MVQQLIRKTFDIRKGELKIALLLQAGIFLIIATLLIVKPVVNALFIDRFGVESLPQAYVILAVVAIVISSLYSRALNYLKLITVILRTLIFSAFALIVFGLLLIFNLNVGWVIYLFYIWTSIFAVLSASQFWILANIVFNIREAKRIFSFIGLGAISGGIVGGYLTSIVVAFTGTKPLLFIAAFLLILCIPINQVVWKKSAANYSRFKRKKRQSFFSDSPLKTILKSPLLTFLAAILGMSVLVARLVEYQFSDVAASHITDPDELAQFFAFWSSNFNLISLFVQLLITRWVVGNYGVGKSLLILPLSITAGALVTFLFPELWAVILLKAMDGSLKQSVNKSAVELLGLPVPYEIKKRTKTFIDVVVDSVATGAAGFILIFIVNGLELDARVVSLVIFLLTGIWIVLAFRVKKEYLHSFQLLSGKSKGAKQVKSVKPSSVVNSFQKIIDGGKVPQIIYLLDQLSHLPDQRFQKHLLPLINHENEEVVVKTVHYLRFYKQALIPEYKIEDLLKSDSDQIRVEAFMYLLKHTKENKQLLIEHYLNHKDEYLSAVALLALAENAKSSFTLRSKELIQKKLQAKEMLLKTSTDEELNLFLQLNLIKIRGVLQRPEDLLYLETQLTSENPQVVKEAIRLLAVGLHEKYILLFIGLLSDKRYRAVSREALFQYGFPVISEIVLYIKQEKVGVKQLSFIPAVFEQFKSPIAVNALLALLNHEDLSVRLESIRSLNKIQSSFPDLNIRKRDVIEKINAECKIYLQTLNMMHTQILVGFRNKDKSFTDHGDVAEARKSLMHLLESRMEGHLERIFGLLGLTYPPDKMIQAYEALQSEHTDIKVNAIEYLDNLLDGDLKRTLIPIVEISILDTISEEDLKDLNLKMMGEFECFSLILRGNDTKLKLAVIYLIGLLKDHRYKPVLQALSKGKNEKVRFYADSALAAIHSSA